MGEVEVLEATAPVEVGRNGAADGVGGEVEVGELGEEVEVGEEFAGYV